MYVCMYIPYIYETLAVYISTSYVGLTLNEEGTRKPLISDLGLLKLTGEGQKC